MASSQQQWRSGSQLLLLAAALALVLLVGFAAAGSDDDGKKCPKGYADCDGNKHNGCETNVYYDPYNCGRCDKECKKYPHTVTKCYKGECKWECDHHYGNCDGNIKNGCETYLDSDKDNCGYCGHKCESHPNHWDWKPYCSGGECQYKCPHGWKYDSHKKSCEKDEH